MKPDDIDSNPHIHPDAERVIKELLNDVAARHDREILNLSRTDDIRMPHGPHGDSLDLTIG
jgi:hypothetical protein